MDYKNIEPLLKAVDTACWCLAVKANTKKGHSCKVDWKSSLVDLQEAWGAFQLANSGEMFIPCDPHTPPNEEENV